MFLTLVIFINVPRDPGFHDPSFCASGEDYGEEIVNLMMKNLTCDNENLKNTLLGGKATICEVCGS